MKSETLKEIAEEQRNKLIEFKKIIDDAKEKNNSLITEITEIQKEKEKLSKILENKKENKNENDNNTENKNIENKNTEDTY